MNLTCPKCQISYHWENILFLGPNFPGMRGLILVLMSNVCYLAVIFILVIACYLVVTAGYCSLRVGYWWLQLVTGGYSLLPVVTGRYQF